ncbi:wax ester/triacylglycerol synthase family O-acyltransferase [Ideonella sp.]|uniref:wax ester/triacylglycerol synthase family O-acyltransferase n=1 Tax=Ideonella sp. TaxID=1929293 RepID=UPI0035B32B16
MSTTHPMSPVDTAWYHMDGPANPAIVTGVAITAQPLDFGRVRREFQRRLLRFDRFRQRVVVQGTALATPVWQDVPDLDLDAHLRHIALPAPGDEATLRTVVEGLASLPLDHRLPLWQAYVVDNVGSGSALVLRYHHCIGDGTAMMAVAARLFDMPHRALRPPARASVPSAPTVVDAALRLAGEAGAVLSDLVKWPDPASPIKGEFGIRKSVAWSAPVPIDTVKAIGAPTGAKVNDVLVAAVSGALRSYLRHRGVDPTDTTLRAMVPMDLRPLDRLGELGNEFGLVILDLPVSAATPGERLARTKAGMDALKVSAEAPAMQLLLDLFGRGPKALEDIACSIFGSKASLVLTNVIGPREGIRLAGVPVERLMFCVPHPGQQIGMGASIMSYQGMATLTVIADARLVPDPQAITQAFNREVAAMAHPAQPRGDAAR